MTCWRAAPILLAFTLLAACGSDGGGGSAGVREQVGITLGDDGCSPPTLTFEEGRLTFVVSNPRSSVVSSFEVLQGTRTIARVTNVLGGLTRTVDVDLEPGSYTLRCANAGKGGNASLAILGPR